MQFYSALESFGPFATLANTYKWEQANKPGQQVTNNMGSLFFDNEKTKMLEMVDRLKALGFEQKLIWAPSTNTMYNVLLVSVYGVAVINMIEYNSNPSTHWNLTYELIADQEKIADLTKVLEEGSSRQPPEDDDGKAIYMLFPERNGGYTYRELPNHIPVDSFNVENYEPLVVEGYERIKADLESAKPRGRIALLDGPPGTGKSRLVQGLILNTNARFVFVSPQDVVATSSPQFLSALINFNDNEDYIMDVDKTRKYRPIVFIIEDADDLVAKRGVDNMSSISAVLNLGDGILGQLLDIRMIMTTNAKKTELDDAITRPGRLSANIGVGPLSVEKANQVFARLQEEAGVEVTGPVFDTPKTLAEVYSAFNDPDFKPAKASQKRKMGFGND